MSSIKNKSLLMGICMYCIIALLFAYFVEYGLKHIPCNLCLIERIPFMITIILIFFVLIYSKYEKIILISIGLIFIFGALVSFYHFGIEQGFFSESLVCELDNIGSGATSAEELLKELGTKSVSCKDVTFKIFGVSLATLNTIISLAISVIMLRTAINYDKN